MGVCRTRCLQGRGSGAVRLRRRLRKLRRCPGSRILFHRGYGIRTPCPEEVPKSLLAGTALRPASRRICCPRLSGGRRCRGALREAPGLPRTCKRSGLRCCGFRNVRSVQSALLRRFRIGSVQLVHFAYAVPSFQVSICARAVNYAWAAREFSRRTSSSSRQE